MSLGELRELVMNREAWHAVIHGVAKSRTQLSDWTEMNSIHYLPLVLCCVLRNPCILWDHNDVLPDCLLKILWFYLSYLSSLVAQKLKRLPPMWETRVWSLGREDPLEKEMAIHSSILAWRIPWMEEPGGLQSTGLQRVGHNWATSPSALILLEKSNSKVIIIKMQLNI